jgi:short-subunit dehydrogenase
VSRVCVITGASQGIGRAAAIRMAAEPDISHLILVARNGEGLEETKRMVGATKAKVESIAMDLSDLEAIPALVKGIHERHGSIDLLLNIAGYAEPKSLLDTTDENIRTTYAVNVFSMLAMIREAVRYMRGRPGKILNVASTAATTSRPGWIAYASSKAAVVSLSQTLADELAGTGIKVYVVSPGRCATELRQKLAPEEDPSTIMQPSQVAEVIASLLRGGENTLDGQNIIVRQQS